MAHVSPLKKQEVSQLKELIESNTVVGLADVEGIKARQMQRIRQDLRGKAKIRGSRNTLIAIALNQAQSRENLVPFLEGSACLICTEMNPFQLNALLEKSRTPALAKPGDIAPEDIVIVAGDTGFPPGPLVGELQRVGVPARIERGSIIVQKDHVFVKAGEEISEKQAEILKKLGIEPMTAGLELLGVSENGSVFEPSVLHVDTEGVISQLGTAHQNALNVGVEAGIITSKTITLLLQKAVRQSISLALEGHIVTKETLSHLLEKAYGNALAVRSLITGEPAQQSVQSVTREKPEATEEKEETKEEALDGLGSLFG